MEYALQKCDACKEGYIMIHTYEENGVEYAAEAYCNYCGAQTIISNDPIDQFGYSKKKTYSNKQVVHFQEKLAKKYHYRPLDPMLSSKYRNLYLVHLPPAFSLDGNAGQALYTSCGTQIANGYRKVVIGDYGAFVEIEPKQLFAENTCCKPGEEYRYNEERYAKNVKYLWLTAKDTSKIKIYQQKKTVPYADYLPDMFYVSPYEIFPSHN